MSHERFTGKRPKKWLFLIIIPAVLALVSSLIMVLWNAILPDLLGTKPITFWQSAGLFLLCKILFGNFRGPSGNRRFGRGNTWNPNQTEDMKTARESLKEEWRRRCRQRFE